MTGRRLPSENPLNLPREAQSVLLLCFRYSYALASPYLTADRTTNEYAPDGLTCYQIAFQAET